ncbi:MAG: hypothetical protein ACRD1Y_15105 [Terriglobales bacterium]
MSAPYRDTAAVALLVGAALEACGIRYAIGGSLAWTALISRPRLRRLASPIC